MCGSDSITFILDDDPDVREALAALVRSVGIEAKTFAESSEFLASYDPDRSGCLVLDVRMPGMSGLNLQTELTARGIQVPIIFLTGHATVPMATRAMKNGAWNLLGKPVRDQTLLDEVHSALAADERRRHDRAKKMALRRRLDLLSPREREVLEFVWAGETTAAIATALGITRKTVQAHRASILSRVHARSMAELIRMVWESEYHRCARP